MRRRLGHARGVRAARPASPPRLLETGQTTGGPLAKGPARPNPSLERASAERPAYPTPLHPASPPQTQPKPNPTPHSQALCVATLGTAADAQRIDGIRSAASDSLAGDSDSESSGPGAAAGRAKDAFETFYLQYFFPPSSVGETGRVGPAGVARWAAPCGPHEA
jgi:hypothetical protein